MRPSSSLPGYVGERRVMSQVEPAPTKRDEPPDGDAPGVHAEMTKLIAGFATKTVRTEGLTLQAVLVDSRFVQLSRPYIRKMQVHNRWGWSVGIESGDRRPPPEAAWYQQRAFAVEQFCGLVHEMTPQQVPGYAVGAIIPDHVFRGSWALFWRELPEAGLLGLLEGKEARYSENNQARVVRALENTPIAIDVAKGEPVHKYEWADIINDWALSGGSVTGKRPRV